MLRLIKAMLKAGSYGEGRLFPTERGTPQGGVHYSPYAKANFQFERVVTGWRGIPVLDLRLKR